MPIDRLIKDQLKINIIDQLKINITDQLKVLMPLSSEFLSAALLVCKNSNKLINVHSLCVFIFYAENG
jgi:hypothetical protein